MDGTYQIIARGTLPGEFSDISLLLIMALLPIWVVKVVKVIEVAHSTLGARFVLFGYKLHCWNILVCLMLLDADD